MDSELRYEWLHTELIKVKRAFAFGHLALLRKREDEGWMITWLDGDNMTFNEFTQVIAKIYELRATLEV